MIEARISLQLRNTKQKLRAKSPYSDRNCQKAYFQPFYEVCPQKTPIRYAQNDTWKLQQSWEFQYSTSCISDREENVLNQKVFLSSFRVFGISFVCVETPNTWDDQKEASKDKEHSHWRIVNITNWKGMNSFKNPEVKERNAVFPSPFLVQESEYHHNENGNAKDWMQKQKVPRAAAHFCATVSLDPMAHVNTELKAAFAILFLTIWIEFDQVWKLQKIPNRNKC